MLFDKKSLSGILNTIIWMWRQMAGYRVPVFASVFIGLVRIVASLFFIWISKEMIDAAVNSGADLKSYSLALVMTLGVEIICSAFQGYIDVRTEVGLRNTLRGNVFRKALNGRWFGKERWHTGDVVNRLEEDVRVVADTLCHLMPGTVIILAQLVGAFIFLWTMNRSLAWAIICILPLFLLMSAVMARKIKKLTSDIRNSDSRVQSILQESLQKRIVIIALSRAGYILKRLDEAQGILQDKVMKRNKFTTTSRTAVMAGFATGYLTAFIWGVHNLQAGVVTFGMLSAFLQLVGLIQRPTADLSRRLPAMIHAMASADRLVEVYNVEQEEISMDDYVSGSRWNGIWNKVRQCDFQVS